MTTVSDEMVRAERIDYEEMVDALDRAGDDFTALVCNLHPDDGERSVPQLDWNVAETAVHMLNIVRRGLGDRRRADSIPGLAVLNAECVAEFESRIPLDIADTLVEDKARLLSILRSQSAEDANERSFPLHAGLRTNIPTALSYMLFDFMAHGLDIARAVGADWSIRPEHAALGLKASLPALGPWATADALAGPRQRLTIGFSGDPTVVVIEVGDGSYAAHNFERAATEDVREVDPVDTFLAVAGRIESADPVAARLASWFEPI